MVKEAKKKNKTDQEIERIKIELTMFEEGLSKKAIDWKAEEIFGLLLILERKTKSGKKIVIRSLERKFYLLKSIFSAEGYPIDQLEERKVRMALNVHIKKRLDKSENPTKDGAAALLSPLEWVRIQEWLRDECKMTTRAYVNKKHMAMLAVAIGFSTGLRLAEIHRLKYSDLDLNGEDEIKIRIRRSKSNRTGHKKVSNVAPGYEAEPLLCPIRNLLEYVEKAEKIMYPGAFIFSNDREGNFLTDKNNLTRYWRRAAAGIGMEKSRWPGAHSHHNAKINMARSLGYSEEQITDAMNWCSVSVLHQYLRKMNEDKEGIAYKLTSLSASDLTYQTRHLWN